MAKRENHVGAPCWVDIMTSDPAKTYAFYGELFGWTVEDPGPQYGGYVNFHKDGEPVAGCMRKDAEMEAIPDLWSVYLQVGDAEATVAAAAAAGATTIVPAMPVHELGSMAVVTDPTDAAIGMWQPGLHTGIGRVNEPGTPAWFELHTRSWEKALDFYRTVFGWDVHVMSDVPEFRYATLGDGPSAAAGVMDASAFLPEGVPAHWSIYFEVEDADAALAKVVSLGGTVVMPAEDTPFGRLATATDTTGATFKLVQPL